MNVAGGAVAALVGAGAYTLYSRSVRLESSELVNHDTKRLRFTLPDKTQSTGLTLTSAVLTISWPKGSWIPTIRPYTPVNDLSAYYT
jgi:cytochrome-b5 reductase